MAEKLKTAVIFPGQASQFVGMGEDLYQAYAPAEDMFDRAGELLGFDLSEVCFRDPRQQLNQTRYTQPCIFVHNLVVFKLLEAVGLAPAVTAGHSLGEYDAVVAAGFLDFEEALFLVSLRGELMQSAGDQAPGSMAAVIGLEDSRVEQICRETGDTVVAANFNSPGQVVISGSLTGVERAMAAARESGARLVKKLKVSGAFHSPLMAPAREKLLARLEQSKFSQGRLPVVPNVTAAVENDPEKIRALLADQLTRPVRWTDSVREMVSLGVQRFIEAGPGNVLAGLVRRIDSSVEVLSLGTVRELEDFRP